MKRDSVITHAVGIAAGIVALLLWLINALFTFTFGSEVIGPMLIPGMLGDDLSALVTGLVCVLFFDLAYTVGVGSFVWLADTFRQRAILALQVLFTFCLSMVASVVSLLLLNDMAAAAVSPQALEAASVAGVIAIIMGFMVSAVAGLGSFVFTPTVIDRIREGGRRSQSAELMAKVQDQLDEQSHELEMQVIQEQLPNLARIRARKTLTTFLARHGATIAELPASHQEDEPEQALAVVLDVDEPEAAPRAVPVTPSTNGHNAGEEDSASPFGQGGK